MTGELLQVEGVTKSYGGIRVLRGVNLIVGQGEIHGLIGANGAGKSTLIDILCGQNTPDQGSVHLDGVPIKGPPARRSRLGLARTFQQPQVALDLTLRENIVLGLAGLELYNLTAIVRRLLRDLSLHRRKIDIRVDEVARRVGLERLERLAGSVSFGEMRLVEVARALISDPSLIILDEPFPGVGDRGLETTQAALESLRDNGHSVLLVDHNVDVVLNLANRVSLLAQGTVVFNGTPEQCRSDEVFRTVYLGEVTA